MSGAYWRKMRGITQSPPRVGWGEIFWSWLGSFLGIAAVAFLHYRFFEGTDLIMIIGSIGASAVLIYGAIKSPLAQPRNLLGGHIISALIGVTMVKVCGPYSLAGRGLGRILESRWYACYQNPASPRWRHRPHRCYQRP